MKVINLTVHGVGATSRDLDPGEDETWLAVEQLDAALDAMKERPDVRITFDDGNSSDVEIALPRLLSRGLTGEFFVLAGRLGEPGRLSKEQVRELVDAGMTVGSHGWAHRDWRRIDQQQAVEEITQANQVLGELTGREVSTVAIPFGSYDRHVLRRLRRAGVSRAYTSDGGIAIDGAWLQPRTSLRHDMDDRWMQQVLDGNPPVLRRVRWLAARTVKRMRG